MEEPTTAPSADETQPSTGRRIAGIARSTAAALAVALGLLCMTVAPAAIWGRNLLLNTDRYVSTLEPLASEPGVQEVVIDLVAGTISDKLDVADRVTGALPKVGPLIGRPLQTTVDSFIRTKTTEFVQSPEFVKLWVGLNRRVHTQIDYILTGTRPKGVGALVVKGSKVELDLSGVVKEVEKRLAGLGLTIAQNIPVVGPTLDIANLHGLEKARSATRLLNTLADVLPVAGLVLIGIGIAASRRRRRTLTIAALGTAAGMFLLLLALLIGRNFYLDGIPTSAMPRATASTIYDTLVRYLRLGIRLVFVVGLLVGAVGWLAGPGEVAGRVRSTVLRLPRALGAKVESSRVGPFVTRYAAALRGGVGGLMVLLFMVSDNPTALTLLVYAAIAVVLLALIELLRAMARPTGA